MSAKSRSRFYLNLSFELYLRLLPYWFVYDGFGTASWLCFTLNWGKDNP